MRRTGCGPPGDEGAVRHLAATPGLVSVLRRRTQVPGVRSWPAEGLGPVWPDGVRPALGEPTTARVQQDEARTAERPEFSCRPRKGHSRTRSLL